MASNDSDDLVPRPVPKPSPVEEICIRPEVPEVSLVFNSSTDPQVNLQCPNSLEPNLNQQTCSKNSNSCAVDNLLNSPSFKSPLKLSENFFPAKKVSFSPQLPVTSLPIQPENICQCTEHGKYSSISSHNHYYSPKPTDNKVLCTCVNDGCEYSIENINSNSYIRLMKNLERKINSKVSYDDLQKTELKLENVLLKHKCKYDKLGEICVSKEDLNKILHKYENQINLLQSRVDELTQKLNSFDLYNHENSKRCGEERIISPCCHLKTSCNSNRPRRNQIGLEGVESENNFHKPISVDLPIPPFDPGHKSCKSARQENHNAFSPERNQLNDDVHQLKNLKISETQSVEVLKPTKTSTNEPYFNSKCHEQVSVVSDNFIQEPRLRQEHFSNDNFALRTSEKNLRLDWAFYNTIVENVKNLVEKSNTVDINCNTVDLIKKATMEQLQKMGINFQNLREPEKYIPSMNYEKNRFISSNATSPSDVGFCVNSLAMKYVSENPEGEYKKSMNDISFRSNSNNISMATMQYMERYHLLPSSEQRFSGNPSYNKCEPNIPQEQRQTYKQIQNNDRSFINADWMPKNY